MCLSCAECCVLAPAGEWRVLYPRQQDVEYSASHRGDHLFITQRDKDHPNSQLFVAPLADPSKRTLLLAHRCAAPVCCTQHWLATCTICARYIALVDPVALLSDAAGSHSTSSEVDMLLLLLLQQPTGVVPFSLFPPCCYCRRDVKLEAISTSSQYLVVFERAQGQQRATVHKLPQEGGAPAEMVEGPATRLLQPAMLLPCCHCLL
jgi:hypothetical protein